MAGATAGMDRPSNPRRRCVIAHKFHRYFGAIGQCRQAQLAQPRLFGQSARKLHITAQCRTHREQQPALNLLPRNVGMDQPPAIDHRGQSAHADCLSVRFDLRHHGNCATTKQGAGQPLPASGIGIFYPAGPPRHTRHIGQATGQSRMLGQHGNAIG